MTCPLRKAVAPSAGDAIVALGSAFTVNEIPKAPAVIYIARGPTPGCNLTVVVNAPSRHFRYLSPVSTNSLVALRIRGTPVCSLQVPEIITDSPAKTLEPSIGVETD